jgi:outer membrane protein assembly factor BamE (lipoprotein component of BamABCDE complex)
MSARGQRARLGLAVLSLIWLTACTTLSRNHGYVPTDVDLAALKVGTDTRESVAEAVGAPGTSGLLADSGWYYVQSRWETYAYREPIEVDRQVVAISFTEGGVVSNIERFGLENGRVIALSRRVTESNAQGVSFLRQLFGNLGRIDPASVFSDSP